MHQVVEDTYIPRKRNAHQRVRQMLIKRRKEPEPMLTRQVLAPIGAGVGNINAARLATEDFGALIHRHRKPALNQLMRGAKPANTTTKNRNRRRHAEDS